MTGKSPATSKQVTNVKVPDWINKAGRTSLRMAQRASMGPETYYEGPQVADTSGLTTDANALIKSGVGAEDPLFANAAKMADRQATELDPVFTKGYGMLAASDKPWDPKPYLNPYTGEVEERAISNAERSLTGRLAGIDTAARKAGAFGGSRAAVERGVAGAEGARSIGDLSAELRRAGYDKATSDMLAHMKLQQEGGSAMIAGAGEQGRLWGSAGADYLKTAAGSQANRLGTAGMLAAAGKEDTAHRQALIDADIGKFEDKKGEKDRDLNRILATLGLLPYGKQESTTGEATSEEKGADWATTGLGIMQLLMSDKDTKTDIEKVGKDPKTGLPMYAYRYKKDPKTYPKVVGPMAQDVAKMKPKAVRSIGGKKVIDPAGMLAG